MLGRGVFGQWSGGGTTERGAGARALAASLALESREQTISRRAHKPIG